MYYIIFIFYHLIFYFFLGGGFRAAEVVSHGSPLLFPFTGGEVLRLRGLPWTAGPAEVAQFLHECLGGSESTWKRITQIQSNTTIQHKDI